MLQKHNSEYDNFESLVTHNRWLWFHLIHCGEANVVTGFLLVANMFLARGSKYAQELGAWSPWKINYNCTLRNRFSGHFDHLPFSATQNSDTIHPHL